MTSTQQRAVKTATIVARCLSTPILVVMALGSRHSGTDMPGLVGMFIAVFGTITALLWFLVFVFGLALDTWPDIAKRTAVGATIVLVVITAIGLGMDLWDRETPSIGLLLLWPILWPPAFVIGMVRRIGWKIGRAATGSVQARLADAKTSSRTDAPHRRPSSSIAQYPIELCARSDPSPDRVDAGRTG